MSCESPLLKDALQDIFTYISSHLPCMRKSTNKVWIESSMWNNVKKKVMTLVSLLEVFMKSREGKRQETRSILMNDLESRITKWTTSTTKANNGI